MLSIYFLSIFLFLSVFSIRLCALSPYRIFTSCFFFFFLSFSSTYIFSMSFSPLSSVILILFYPQPTSTIHHLTHSSAPAPTPSPPHHLPPSPFHHLPPAPTHHLSLSYPFPYPSPSFTPFPSPFPSPSFTPSPTLLHPYHLPPTITPFPPHHSTPSPTLLHPYHLPPALTPFPLHHLPHSPSPFLPHHSSRHFFETRPSTYPYPIMNWI